MKDLVEGQAVADAAGTQRPLVGVYAGLRTRAQLAPLRVRALCAEAALQGADLAFFDAAGVDMAARRIRAERLRGEAWETVSLRLPDVAMNPFHTARPDGLRIEHWLRGEMPFTTHRIANKAGVAILLGRSPLASHVIPFVELPIDRLDSVLAAFLAQHGSIVLKPVNGKRGRGLLFVEPGDGALQLQEDRRRSSIDLAGLAGLARQRASEQPFVAQRCIPARARDGRAYDVRVHVQKGGDGQWALTRSYVRLGDLGLRVSNTSQGGLQGEPVPFLSGLFGARGAALADQLAELGMRTAIELDRVFDRSIDELGVDLVLDPAGHPFILEVNTHPQTRLHELERARRAVAYALYLARNRLFRRNCYDP